ncbi:MAG: DUF5023 domain-containing protein [Oscillospiraceae bacterium]
MIKYLHRLKGKKGFTFIELVIVIAIIGVLITVMAVSLLGGTTEKVLSHNANAEVFFPACQLAFTRAQLTERSLVTYDDADLKYIEYKDGANKIMDGKYLFLEAKFEENGMVGLHIDVTLNGLMSKDDITDTNMTVLEQYFAKNINEYLTDSYDGYFYALVDNNYKVLFTHFCEVRLPTFTMGGDVEAFRNSLMISDGKVVGNGAVLGSCSDTYTVPMTGDYAFAVPELTDLSKKSLYFM